MLRGLKVEMIRVISAEGTGDKLNDGIRDENRQSKIAIIMSLDNDVQDLRDVHDARCRLTT